MPIRNLHYIPVAIFLWFPATFLISYIIAVQRNDVYAVFPYISDTGTFSPESCIFGQMLNFGAILMASGMYIRYRLVNIIYEKHNLTKRLLWLNKVSVWLGICSASGITVVGNFQETNILTIHLIGATLAFGLGSIYQCLQTKISFIMFPKIGTRNCNFIRILIAAVSSANYIMASVFASISIELFTGTDMIKWKEEDGGYIFHVVSTVTEWVSAISSMAYMLTFTSEFRSLVLYEPVVILEEQDKINSHAMHSLDNGTPDIERLDTF